MAYKLEKEILKRRYGRKCMLCGRKLKDRDCTFHHIIPKYYGGNSEIENGAILCGECQTIIHLFEYGAEGYEILTKAIKSKKK